MTDKKPVVERDPTTAMKKAMATIQKSNQDIELQRMELTRQRDTAIKLATALRTYFATPGHIPFEEVTSNSNILFGKSAAIILDAVKPTKEGTIKQASVPVNLTAAPYSLVKQAIELASTFVTKREAYNAAVKTAYDESSQLLRPFGRTPAQGLSVMADLCSPQIKHGGFSDLVRSGFGVMTAGNIGQEIARKVPGTQPTTALEQGDLSSLMDPAHEREIRNIQSEAMLNDLIANDDVIRGYDPEEAVDAFNEISQLAPYSSNTKVIMRDLMRKRLAGGASALDQFTVGDTLGQQQKLRDLNTPNEPRMNALKDLGVMSRAQPSVIGGHKPH
jgi:hypothetical protein